MRETPRRKSGCAASASAERPQRAEKRSAGKRPRGPRWSPGGPGPSGLKTRRDAFSAVSPVFPLPPRGDYPIVYHKRGRITTGSRGKGLLWRGPVPRGWNRPQLPSTRQGQKAFRKIKGKKLQKQGGRTSVRVAGICEKRSEKAGKRGLRPSEKGYRAAIFLGKRG